MLYQAIEAHLASLTPARLTARWMHQMMSHPMLPHSYTTGFRAAAAWFELFDRTTQRHLKPAFGLHGMPRRVYTYSAGFGFETLNLIETVGSFVLASSFHLPNLAPLASVPAMIAAIVLERWTRQPRPEPIPTAIARADAG